MKLKPDVEKRCTRTGIHSSQVEQMWPDLLSLFLSVLCGETCMEQTAFNQAIDRFPAHFTDLLVSHSLTRLSREPETSWCSCEGAHFTAVTQPVWEVRDRSTSDPSGGERRRFITAKRKSKSAMTVTK